MPPPRRLRAPAGNAEVLADPGFDAVPALVIQNRRRLDRADVLIDGVPLRDFRALARREVLAAASSAADPDAPLLLAGHQPELSHPGVWVKNFALHGLARAVGGTPLNLVVDNDTLKAAALRVPVVSADGPAARLETVAFDCLDGEVAYEDRRVADPAVFASFADRVAALTRDWGFAPLLPRAWAEVVRHPPHAPVGERFTHVRRCFEGKWGCANAELPVSRLSATDAFARFARHVLADLSWFRAVYNAAIHEYRATHGIRSKNHPAPELADGEAPFWVTGDGRRGRATPASDPGRLRPRALTLTLFARVCVGDFFVHGIGGGKYDEVTDAIIRGYFGVDPPAYQVVSATLHLPLPGFDAGGGDVARTERHVRDLHWNPQRHLNAEHRARPEVQSLLAEKAALTAHEPPHDHAARRQWFRDLQMATEKLRPFVGEQLVPAYDTLDRAQRAARANAVIRRRDFSWVLYPEETLRPFLQRFL